MTTNRSNTRSIRYNRRQPERPSGASIAIITILVTTLIAIFVVNCFFVGDHKENKFADQSTFVQWEYVNLRQNHNVGSDVIDQLHAGDKVELTSNVFEAWDTEWIYIRSEKGNGWVVTAALQNPID